MPVRTGEQFIGGIRQNAVKVYVRGERVKDVAANPAFRNAIDTLACLLERQ